jgi:hypothetical protein
MAKTVVGLMDTSRAANDVVQELTNNCRCDRSDISLVARGSQGEFTGGAGATGDVKDEKTSGALKGAGAGAALGGIAGFIAGAASLAIPGIGPIIAAGPIASALAGAGLGAVAGGLIGGLTRLGVPEDEAHYYAEGVKRGGTLITVHARNDDMADCAARVMKRYGAADIEKRAMDWKKQGWGGRVSDEDRALPLAQEEESLAGTGNVEGVVRVYSYAIETAPADEMMPEGEERAVGQAGQQSARPGSRSAYRGPERRKGRGDYVGAERRAGI